MRAVHHCAFAIALAWLGCAPPPPPPPPPHHALGPTVGVLGRAGFGLWSVAGTGLDQPIAAGGHVLMQVEVDSSAPPVARVDSSDSMVATFAPDVPQTLPSRFFNVQVTAGGAGTAAIELFDAAGQPIDHADVIVETTDEIRFARGWTGASPTLLTLSAVRFVVGLFHGGHRLAGNGVTRFTDVGVSAQSPSDAPPPGFQLASDEEDHVVGSFRAGTATITATVGTATATQALTLVDASAVDGLDAPAMAQGGTCCGAIVSVRALVKGAPIYGAECGWSSPGLNVTPWLGCGILDDYPGETTAAPAGWVYQLSGALGSYQATCVIGNASANIALTITNDTTGCL